MSCVCWSRHPLPVVPLLPLLTPILPLRVPRFRRLAELAAQGTRGGRPCRAQYNGHIHEALSPQICGSGRRARCAACILWIRYCACAGPQSLDGNPRVRPCAAGDPNNNIQDSNANGKLPPAAAPAQREATDAAAVAGAAAEPRAQPLSGAQGGQYAQPPSYFPDKHSARASGDGRWAQAEEASFVDDYIPVDDGQPGGTGHEAAVAPYPLQPRGGGGDGDGGERKGLQEESGAGSLARDGAKPMASEVSSTVVCDLGELEARSPLVQEMQRQILKEELRSGRKNGATQRLISETAQRRVALTSAAAGGRGAGLPGAAGGSGDVARKLMDDGFPAKEGKQNTPSAQNGLFDEHRKQQQVLGLGSRSPLYKPVSPMVGLRDVPELVSTGGEHAKHANGKTAALRAGAGLEAGGRGGAGTPAQKAVSKWSDPLQGPSKPVRSSAAAHTPGTIMLVAALQRVVEVNSTVLLCASYHRVPRNYY